jgi:CheY-like chemotaxis protein
MDRPRVLLAEDHAPIAEQLRTLLEPEFAENVMRAWAKLAAERLSAWTKGTAKPA